VHIYQVIIYKLIQHYAHNGSKIVIQSRHFHHGSLATTAVINEAQLHEQNAAIDSCLHCYAHI